MKQIIRRAITRWILWRSDRRIYRRYPHLKERAVAIQAARKAHKPTRHIIEEQQQEMLRLLREGN